MSYIFKFMTLLRFLQLVGCVWMLLRVHQRHYLSVRAEELYEQVQSTVTFLFTNHDSVVGDIKPVVLLYRVKCKKWLLCTLLPIDSFVIAF